MIEVSEYKGILTRIDKLVTTNDSKITDKYDVDILEFNVTNHDTSCDDTFRSQKNDDGTIFFIIKYRNDRYTINDAIEKSLGDMK
jgi:hypothetical protein